MTYMCVHEKNGDPRTTGLTCRETNVHMEASRTKMNAGLCVRPVRPIVGEACSAVNISRFVQRELLFLQAQSSDVVEAVFFMFRARERHSFYLECQKPKLVRLHSHLFSRRAAKTVSNCFNHELSFCRQDCPWLQLCFGVRFQVRLPTSTCARHVTLQAELHNLSLSVLAALNDSILSGMHSCLLKHSNRSPTCGWICGGGNA